MSLRFADGFDEYTTVLEKWTTTSGPPTIVAAAARTGAAGFRLTDTRHYAQLTLDAQGTWYVGSSYRRATLSYNESQIHSTIDAGTLQGRSQMNLDGTISVCRGSTVVATSASATLANSLHDIETKHVIADAGGILECRVDGVVWVTFAGDSKQTANATANGLQLGGASSNNGQPIDFDDLYICDGVDQSVAEPGSPANNSYLGDVKCAWSTATGAGTTTGLTPSAGNNWQCVDEVPPNTTDYVSGAVVDVYDTYALTDLAVAGNIYAIILELYAVKTDAGAANVAHVYRSGGTDYTGTDIALSTSWARYMRVRGANEKTAAAFTKADVDALEMGPKVR